MAGTAHSITVAGILLITGIITIALIIGEEDIITVTTITGMIFAMAEELRQIITIITGQHKMQVLFHELRVQQLTEVLEIM